MKAIFTPKWVTLLAILIILAGLLFERSFETIALLGNLMLVAWLAIAMHELGHVIFGKWNGFEFVFFTVGPVRIERTADGIQLKENRIWLFFGGMAMMIPPQIQRETILKKWIMFTAGGPFLSLLLGSVSWLLYEWFSVSFLLYSAIMNVAILLATIVPFKTSMQTDGHVLLTLLKNNDASHKFIEETLVSAELLCRKKPSEWNSKYIQIAKQKTASIENLQYAMMIYYYEIEKNGFQAAVQAMVNYRAIPVTKQNNLQLGFLIHMQQIAHFLRDDVQIEIMTRLQKQLSLMEPLSYYRGLAIISCLRKDRRAVLKNIQRVRKIIEQNETLYGFFKAEQTLTKLVEEKIASYLTEQGTHAKNQV